MAEKNLKISVKSDLREGNKLSTFITEIQKKVEKLAKTLGSVNIGGGPTGPGGQQRPGQQGLSKQLEADKRGMDALGRGVDDLHRKFQNLSNTLNTTAGRMRSVSSGGLVDRFGNPLSSAGGGPLGGTAASAQAGAGTAGGAGGIGVPTNLAGGAGGRGVGGILSKVMPFAPYAAGAWGINQMMSLLLNAPQRAIDFASVGGQAASGGNAAMGGLGARLLQGDVTPALGLMRLSGRGNGNTGFTKQNFAEIINASPDQARNMAIQRGISLDLANKIPEMVRGLDPRAKAARMNELYSNFIEMAGRSDPLEGTTIGYAQQQAPGRVGFARRQGRDFAAGIPLGSAVDPQQTMATVSAVLDVLGTGTNVTKVTRLVTEATRLGISSDAVQAMLRSQEMGGGDLMGRILGSGLSRPMMGRAGGAAAAMASQSLQRLNSEVFAGGFVSGGAGTDELTMRRREAGAGFLNQVTTGGLDEYQKTVNIALATKKGRSVYTTQTLANMPFNELLNAAIKGPTADQIALGVSQPMAREQLNAEVNSLSARAVKESGVDVPPAIRRLLEVARGPGGISGGIGALQAQGTGGLAGLGELSAGLAAVNGLQPGSEAAEFLGGVLSPGAKGKSPKETRGMFGTALESGFAGSREMERDFGHMKLAMDDLKAVVKTMPETVNQFRLSMESITPEAVASSATALNGLGDAMGEIAENGPAAVNVLNHVRDFINSVAGKKAAEAAAAPIANAKAEAAIRSSGHLTRSSMRGH